jgi:hypothetical protein
MTPLGVCSPRLGKSKIKGTLASETTHDGAGINSETPMVLAAIAHSVLNTKHHRLAAIDRPGKTVMKTSDNTYGMDFPR